MHLITIKSILASKELVPVVDVFLCIGRDVISNLTWKVSNIECDYGLSAKELCRISDNNIEVSGVVLLDLIANVFQVVDGDFVGYLPRTSEMVLHIRSVDSTYYDIESNDLILINRLREKFPQA